ncbi:nicotinate-nucleotide adenylyltransferase [Pyruvatibacter sp.]|uniref:nicotinate-nucleotide adenylyltransferase n=1 Tax=Pyruvatibacter sp. TaxID=1981328 RepID=UPI0032EBC63D
MAVTLGSGLLKGLRIGLLGGSFNPAHDAHRHISLVALRHLNLHQVWWLVSPQNPLKSERGMAPFEQRMQSARDMAQHPAIRVTDMETQLGTRYTADTVRALTRRAPATHFVWLMGADNLLSFPRWHQWTRLMHSVPVAVIARPGYSLKARLSHAATRYAHSQYCVEAAAHLPGAKPPAWVFIEDQPNTLSSTRLRQELGAQWHTD